MSKTRRIKESGGDAFANARQMGSRHRAITAQHGGAEDYVRSPVRVRPDQACANPENPRDEITETELAELAESMEALGQIQPATVMTRGAYLAVLPQHEQALGMAEYVVISGSRRLAAARKAGLDAFLIHVNDTPSTREQILEYALVENIQRQDLSPLAEAHALQGLCEVYGTQALAGQRLGKTQGWVSQRLRLLKLIPQVQEDLQAGALTLWQARELARMEPEEQERAREGDYYALISRSEPHSERRPAPEPSPEGGQDAPEQDLAPIPPASIPAPGKKSQPEPQVDDEFPGRDDPAPPAPQHEDDQPVQLMLNLKWEPEAAATKVVRAYGSDRAREMAEAILAQV